MSAPEQKRRKIALACVECRERKRKCDGRRPSCGNCLRRNPQPECIYTDESLKRGSSGYVESLRNRIRELEDQVKNQKGFAPILPAATDATGSLPLRPDSSRPEKTEASTPGIAQHHAYLESQRPFPGWQPDQRAVQSSYLPLPLEDSIASDSSSQDDEHGYLDIGSMGVPGGTICYHCRGSRLYKPDASGPANDVDFDRQVRKWTKEQISEASAPTQHADNTPRKICRCWAGRRMNIAHAATRWVLPERAQADSFVENYFQWVYTLFPYIIRPIFMHHYQQVWRPSVPEATITSQTPDADADIFFCQLNAIFALGTQFVQDQDAKWKATMGKMFYDRILLSLKFDVMERGTVELVQTLIVTAQYLQTTQLWEMCWNFSGLAIRVAQSIGLHVTPPRSEGASREMSFAMEEETRRRTWAGCVALDRTLSALYGKPQMLHPSLTRNYMDSLPYRSDESIMANRNTNINKPHLIEFFTHSVKLMHIFGNIIDLQYVQETPPDEQSQSDLNASTRRAMMPFAQLQKILRMDALLLKLNTELPRHLDLSLANPGTVFGRQAHVMKMRHLHARVYLLRPVLLDLYRHHADQGSEREYSSVASSAHINTLTTMARTCLDASISIVDYLYTDEYGGRDSSHLWWFGIHYAYFSATVLHAGRLCARVADVQDDSSLQQSFEKCLLCLRKYEVHSRSAKTCRYALEVLEKRAFPVQQALSSASETVSWVADTTYPGGVDTAFNPFRQFSVPADPVTTQSGYYASGIDQTGLSTTADNYFWTTFMPDTKPHPYQ